MSTDTEEDIGSPPPRWESGAASDAEREQLRKAYELGKSAPINGPEKDAALAELQKMYDAAGSNSKEAKRLRNAFAAGAQEAYKKLKPGEGGRKPEVQLKIGKKPREAREIKRLLIAQSAHANCPASDKLFRSGSEIVHLSRNKLSDADAATTGDVPHDENYHVANDLLVKTVDIVWLGDRVERTIDFVKLDKEGNERTTEPPEKLLKRVCAIITDKDFAPLAGTVETPTLRKDWSLLDKPGYDSKSMLYFDPGRTVFPAIPDKPTKVDAYHALELFTGDRGILHDFPFTDDKTEPKGLSLSVAMAMMLTAVCRRSLETAPMFVVNAFEAQSGKTWLGYVAGIIGTGRIIAARPWQANEYQREQSLAMALESGDPVLLFDNLTTLTPLEGACFNLALTAPLFECRRLGSNSGKDRLVALTNALMVSTGNHVVIGGDMTEGRTLMTNIIPTVPHAQRHYLYPDLLNHVLVNRPQLVAALLTILRGYACAADKRPPTKFRHRQWGDLVAAAVQWLRLPDPCLAEHRAKVTDPLREVQQDVVRAWAIEFGDRWIETPTIIANDKIAGIIAGWLDTRPERLTHRQVAPFLLDLLGVRLLGFKVEHIPSDKHRSAKWHLGTEREGDKERYQDFKGMAQAAQDFGREKEEFTDETVPAEDDSWLR